MTFDQFPFGADQVNVKGFDPVPVTETQFDRLGACWTRRALDSGSRLFTVAMINPFVHFFHFDPVFTLQVDVSRSKSIVTSEWKYFIKWQVPGCLVFLRHFDESTRRTLRWANFTAESVTRMAAK